MAAEAEDNALRLFLAITPPKTLLAKLQDLQEHLKGESWDVRWSRPQDFHITVHFLGKTAERLVDDLQRELSACVHALRPFELSAGGLGVFPDVDRPRILWAGIQDRHGKLEELFHKTRRVLGRYRLFSLSENFSPHMTVGRVRDLKFWEGSRLAALQQDWKRLGPLPVEEVKMLKSERSSSGAVYHEVFKVKLGGE